MLKLKTLELHNYLSIDDAKLDLENRGVILIEGKNHSNNAYQSNGAGNVEKKNKEKVLDYDAVFIFKQEFPVYRG